MRGVRICLTAAVALAVAAVSGAAGPMALTQEGDLYMASTRDNQVVVSARYADGSVEELFVPQSAAAIESSLQVGVDETTGALCESCETLAAYAQARLFRCVYQEAKPTCANCPIHCYRPDMREQVRAVMRYAGPRMLLRHPYLAIMHLLDGLRKAPEIRRGW